MVFASDERPSGGVTDANWKQQIKSDFLNFSRLSLAASFAERIANSVPVFSPPQNWYLFMQPTSN